METLKRLYVAFIHPNLEYATAVWDPYLSNLCSVLHAGSVPKDGMMPILILLFSHAVASGLDYFAILCCVI